MAHIAFLSPPNGEIILDPELGWLHDLILYGTEDYWSAGTGQASLKRENKGQQEELLLTMEAALGFYLEHVDQDNVYHVSIGQGSFGHAVTVYVGGDPLVLPQACFVPREQAWAAVADFYRTGERSKAVTWKTRSEINWDYGYSEKA